MSDSEKPTYRTLIEVPCLHFLRIRRDHYSCMFWDEEGRTQARELNPFEGQHTQNTWGQNTSLPEFLQELRSLFFLDDNNYVNHQASGVAWHDWFGGHTQHGQELGFWVSFGYNCMRKWIGNNCMRQRGDVCSYTGLDWLQGQEEGLLLLTTGLLRSPQLLGDSRKLWALYPSSWIDLQGAILCPLYGSCPLLGMRENSLNEIVHKLCFA